MLYFRGKVFNSSFIDDTFIWENLFWGIIIFPNSRFTCIVTSQVMNIWVQWSSAFYKEGKKRHLKIVISFKKKLLTQNGWWQILTNFNRSLAWLREENKRLKGLNDHLSIIEHLWTFQEIWIWIWKKKEMTPETCWNNFAL